MRGIKMPPPKAYARMYQDIDDDTWQTIAAKKRQQIDELNPDNTLDRLRVKEKIKLKKSKQLTRNLQ